MKLTHIRVKDFRSFSGEHEFAVANGVNYVVGPNNCGKSNLIRALELALDADALYVPEWDRPARDAAVGAPPTTRITLTFRVDGRSGPEETLLTRAEAYEVAVRKARRTATTGNIKTYAAEQEIRLVTTFGGRGVRQTTFQAKGQGASSLAVDDPIFRKLESQFRSVVRFGVVHSGVDLESLLKGKFREILQLVIADHLSDEMAQAEAARHEYQSTLQAELLEPLRERVLERVGWMFPEITIASLLPNVPTLDETLSSVDVRLGDSMTTALADKGTGVRGAVLVSMLQYLAEQSRRSLVLAVEEPEAFLHPAGQEVIRGQLQDLARRSDVSLLVTTHSPYVIAREADTLVTELRKDKDGVTRRAGTARGDEPRAELLGSLYRDAGMATVVERALTVPHGSKGVLITEGYTDGEFIRLALEAARQLELLDGLHMISAGGASKVVFQAVLASSATELPVVALLDKDPHGKSALETLEAFQWSKQRELVSLAAWPGGCKKGHDVEIEDLFPCRVIERVTQSLGGEDLGLDAKERCGDSWHYRCSKAWKAEALRALPSILAPTDADGFLWLVKEINARVAKVADAKMQAALHGANRVRLNP